MAGEIWREKGRESSGRENWRRRGAVVLAAKPFGFCSLTLWSLVSGPKRAEPSGFFFFIFKKIKISKI